MKRLEWLLVGLALAAICASAAQTAVGAEDTAATTAPKVAPATAPKTAVIAPKAVTTAPKAAQYGDYAMTFKDLKLTDAQWTAVAEKVKAMKDALAAWTPRTPPSSRTPLRPTPTRPRRLPRQRRAPIPRPSRRLN